MSGVDDAMGDLPPDERGLVLGLVLAGTPSCALQRLVGDATSCRNALDAMRALPRETRVALLAGEAESLPAWDPKALAEVDPTWFREALAQEPDWVKAAVVQALPPPIRACVSRALGGMDCEPAPLASGVASGLCRTLLGAVERLATGGVPPAPDLAGRGARLLGASLSGAPPSVLARAMASVGEPWAAEIAMAARQADQHARDEARALVARARPQGTTALDRLEGLAIESLRSELPPRIAGALAVRLPAAQGRRLL